MVIPLYGGKRTQTEMFFFKDSFWVESAASKVHSFIIIILYWIFPDGLEKNRRGPWLVLLSVGQFEDIPPWAHGRSGCCPACNCCCAMKSPKVTSEVLAKTRFRMTTKKQAQRGSCGWRGVSVLGLCWDFFKVDDGLSGFPPKNPGGGKAAGTDQ